MIINISIGYSQIIYNNYGDMTLGNSTGTLYQFAGLQGTDNTAQTQGGFGILSGNNQVSPIIWMYSFGGNNAFQVKKKSYNGTVQDGTTLFHVGVNGNVGLGNSSPEEKLHIKDGNVLFEMNSQNGTDPRILFQNEGNGANVHQTFYRWSGGGEKYFATRLYEGYKKFSFQVSESSAEYGDHTFIDAMTILQSGNVGIGTTTPQNKLSVEGSVWAKKIKISLEDAADWVFEDDYNLRTLEEVESFIQTNKHLPEIPSAEEFKKNDMDVAEMNNKLLQKVEELTLYIIDQNKRIKKLEEELNKN